ncbi:MAG TPA: 2-amino-4-hydroxy-6-hydroxymethyldihydropteridine diphosphokinase [Anaerolineales bacterium]|nr:2-amino-4-hydroxy-6-hydroxymethyldihydropteridine diphosphokinase [Anaerolineales bacterium]
MNDLHRAYLSLGSNIDPAAHLAQAVRMLKDYGPVQAVSRIWESHAVGSDGPDFLNACVLFASNLQPEDVKERIIRPIEAKLGRIRSADKNAPRTVDLDMVLFDETPLNIEFWAQAFVVVPLAELIPEFIHPVRGEELSRVAEQLQSQVWIVPRPEVLIL